MITEHIIAGCIREANEISKVEMMVCDMAANTVAKTSSAPEVSGQEIMTFIDSDTDRDVRDGLIFLRISDENEPAYVLVSAECEGALISAALTAAQIRNLIVAYRDKNDKNTFFQDLLLDNLLIVDIYNRASKLHVKTDVKRCVFVMESVGKRDDGLIDMVRELFSDNKGDHVTAVDENRVVVIRELSDDESEEDLEETARMLVDMSASEAASDVRVSYGTIKDDIKGIAASYREARLALDVAGIFYPQKKTIEYTHLGVGRLIYQLPVDLCRLFVKEIFGDDIPEEIDDEMLTTVNKFFENNLNVSETSRQLFIHRNTLIYRIEKLQKATGLDMRVFDDALTLKIALMVVNYMKYQSIPRKATSFMNEDSSC